MALSVDEALKVGVASVLVSLAVCGGVTVKEREAEIVAPGVSVLVPVAVTDAVAEGVDVGELVNDFDSEQLPAGVIVADEVALWVVVSDTDPVAVNVSVGGGVTVTVCVLVPVSGGVMVAL